MIRIAICDDEKQILDEVSEYIAGYAQKNNYTDIEVFRFESARSLLSDLEDGRKFDIFVLDVYIGDEMGTSLARNIRKLGIFMLIAAAIPLRRPRLTTPPRATKRERFAIL